MADSDLPRTSLLTKYRDSMQELQETLIQEKKWRQDAEGENRMLRKKHLEIEEINTDFRFSAVEYMSRIEDLDGENKKLSAKCDELLENLEKLEELYERQQIRGDTLEKELDQMEENASEFRKELSQKQRLVEDFKVRASELEKNLQNCEIENFEVKEETQMYKIALGQCEEKLNLKEEECKALYDNFKVIDEENNKFREQEIWVMENQKLLENKTQLLIEDERKLLANYKNKLSFANEVIEGLQSEKEKVLKNCEKSLENERKLEKKIAELGESLEKSQVSQQKQEKLLKNAQEELCSMREKLEQVQQEAFHCKDQANSLQKETNLLKGELHTKNQVIYEVSTKNKELSSQIQNLAETIELEKINHAKIVFNLSQKSEKNLNSLLKEAKQLHDEEMRTQLQELESSNKKYLDCLDYIKEKEEENENINKDRENLQDMVRELDSKLRELIKKFQIDSEALESLQVQHSEEQQKRISAEKNCNSLNIQLKELESQYCSEIDSLNRIIRMNKSQLKDVKKQIQSEAEEKNRLADDTVSYWKEKFREEVGYLEKWAETLSSDLNATLSFSRVSNMAKRLSSALDHTFL